LSTVTGAVEPDAIPVVLPLIVADARSFRERATVTIVSRRRSECISNQAAPMWMRSVCELRSSGSVLLDQELDLLLGDLFASKPLGLVSHCRTLAQTNSNIARRAGMSPAEAVLISS
jgi:hypothetical protein